MQKRKLVCVTFCFRIHFFLVYPPGQQIILFISPYCSLLTPNLCRNVTPRQARSLRKTYLAGIEPGTRYNQLSFNITFFTDFYHFNERNR